MDNMGICVCTNNTKKYKSDSDCFDVDTSYYYKVFKVQAARRGEIVERKKVKVYVDIEMEYPIEFSTDQFDEFFKPV